VEHSSEPQLNERQLLDAVRLGLNDKN